MKRKPAAPVFKPYVMDQPQLLPPSLDEVVEADHLVRVVNAAEVLAYLIESGCF